MKRTLQIRRVLSFLSIYFALIDSYFFNYFYVYFIYIKCNLMFTFYRHL